ncbi:hypothetical protein A3K63_01665 [Candidatus Micrarchaeota archaeon RBG_16_49_10]|nr:MAG: hypothetical protein A3K63_01665 [Candidatus Micrarchaeota archaeon RBG_16_49_10]
MEKEDDSVFVEMMGGYPLIRVLDFLMTFREFDYPLTAIAKNSGVGWSTLHTFFPNLIKNEFVIETRKVGRAKMYKLNTKNTIIRKLIELDNEMCEIASRELIDDYLKTHPDGDDNIIEKNKAILEDFEKEHTIGKKARVR